MKQCFHYFETVNNYRKIVEWLNHTWWGLSESIGIGS